MPTPDDQPLGGDPTIRDDRPARRHAARFTPGQVIGGRYRLVAMLGRGGMGEVFRADDLKLGTPVALKFLPERVARDPRRLERLLEEVRLARQVSHANVCRVFDVGEEDGQHFVSMEYIDGEDLDSLLHRIGRLAPEKVSEIGRQLCAALASIHQQGVIHKDLKPANVMLDGRGRVRITDFGIAALSADAKEADRAGTPAYMAPERLGGKAASEQSDIYALGVMLYEISTGRHPLGDSTSAEDIESAQRSLRSTLTTSTADGLDPALEQLILRCLEPDPRRRPSSALAVAAALPGADPLAAALSAGETPSPELVAESGSSDRLHPAIVAALVVLILGVSAASIVVRSHFSLARFAPVDKSPAVMMDRAREMLERLGLAERADFAWGYDASGAYRTWIFETIDDEQERLDQFARARPSYIYFWYRQSPETYRRASSNFDRGIVSAELPAWTIPGESYISLDLDGRLRRVYVVPPNARVIDPNEPEITPAPYDFEPLFEMAGLEFDAFEEVSPRYIWNHTVDERRAWLGAYPEEPDLPLRVEAAALQGNLAYFRFLTPWEDPHFEATVEADADDAGEGEEPAAGEDDAGTDESASDEGGRTIQQVLNDFVRTWVGPIVFTVLILLLFGAGVMTRRNLRSGRGDVDGATRLALFAGVCMAMARGLASDSLMPRGQFDVMTMLAWGVFIGMGTWVAYLAIEPGLRRRWPTSLISWTRLLSGQFGDPWVGRSLLAGLAAGVLVSAAHRGVFIIDALDSEAFEISFGFKLVPLQYTLANLFVRFSVGILLAFIYLLIFVVIKRLVRYEWLAALIVIPLLMLFNEKLGHSTWSPAVVFAWALLAVALFLRFGVLSVVACIIAEAVLSEAVGVASLNVWYIAGMALPAGVIGAMTLWGAWAAAFGGRRRTPRASTADSSFMA